MTERESAVGEPSEARAATSSFEATLERLDAIAGRLEAGDTHLEEALTLFEEGVRLSKTASARLDEAERKLEILLEDGRTAPLDGQAPNKPPT